MTTPVYFGARERRLFGIYEPGTRSGQYRRAAVLCQPFGMEYTYAHRALRLLAGRLATAGFHTLRFDYHGTGDSAGNRIEDGIASLEADIDSAISELGAIADTKSVALVGLRLGATLAAHVAARNRSVDVLVLWDAVVSGDAYLQGMTPVPLAPPAEAAVGPAEVQNRVIQQFDLEGCLVVEAFLGDLRALELAPVLAAATCRRLALFTHPPVVPPALQPLAGTPGVTCETVASPAPWTERASSAGLVPTAAIQRVVDWLA